jgi:hypothetical protein
MHNEKSKNKLQSKHTHTHRGMEDKTYHSHRILQYSMHHSECLTTTTTWIDHLDVT